MAVPLCGFGIAIPVRLRGNEIFETVNNQQPVFCAMRAESNLKGKISFTL